LAINQRGYSSEPSYGTHFFQDLVETEIYPIAIYPEEGEDYLDWDFLKQSADQFHSILPRESSDASRCIKVIDILGERPSQSLDIVMDGQRGLGYLTHSA